MEDFRRNPASPTSINEGSMTKKRSQSDLRQKMRFLSGKENEETAKKHFMSPTFSASSKARKKLSLIDRNEEEEVYTSATFSTCSKLKKNVFIEKNQDYTVSIYTCEQTLASPGYPLSPVTPTASKPPYNPRPKVLLYNPDKQRDGDLEKMGLSESQAFDEMSPPHRESVKEEGSESTDFEDDSDEELEEEKQGMLYKVMKLLFLLCAIVLSTLYISSMNLPETGHFLSLQGYQSFQDSANEFALGSVFLNQTLGKESRTVFDQIHLSDEGEVATETSDLLQVFVNENVVGKVLEDSSKLSDPLDLNEDREIRAENLRLPYVTGIQVFPISIESTDEVLFDEKVTACEGTGEEEMDVGHQVGTVVNTLDAIGARTNPRDVEIMDRTDSSGESAKMEGFSYEIDEQRIILGNILSTCEVVDSARRLGDDQTMRIEAMVTDVVLAMGGIASLVGGIALLTITLRIVWRVFTKPSERVPSPVTQECVEPVLVEDSRDLLLAKKGESTEEKEQFTVERRLIELCHFRAPTVELLGEYVVSPEFNRSSLKKFTRGSSPVEAQQTKREIFSDNSSVSASCSNTSLDSNRRFGRDKIVREEEGSTTALRRSSRIRNKTVSSQL